MIEIPDDIMQLARVAVLKIRERLGVPDADVEIIARLVLSERQKCAEALNDKDRLDYLDWANRCLNARYGTTYGWEFIQSPNVNRLMAGNLKRFDLNDARAHGASSCREVLDRAILASAAYASFKKEHHHA